MNELSTLVGQVFAMQKKYGETAELAEYRDAGFQWLLGGYSIKQIKKAFEVYLKNKDDLPSPSNIIEIIENKPKMSEAVYKNIKEAMKSTNQYVTPAEKQYIKDYERSVFNGGYAMDYDKEVPF